MSLLEQFKSMECLPVLEYPILLDGSYEWLTVDINVTEEAVTFSFDTEGLPVYFDGDIVEHSQNFYSLPIENSLCDSNSLDKMIQVIDANISEGFIMPNNLERLTC